MTEAVLNEPVILLRAISPAGAPMLSGHSMYAGFSTGSSRRVSFLAAAVDFCASTVALVLLMVGLSLV